jgi:ribosomal protein L5
MYIMVKRNKQVVEKWKLRKYNKIKVEVNITQKKFIVEKGCVKFKSVSDR